MQKHPRGVMGDEKGWTANLNNADPLPPFLTPQDAGRCVMFPSVNDSQSILNYLIVHSQVSSPEEKGRVVRELAMSVGGSLFPRQRHRHNT